MGCKNTCELCWGAILGYIRTKIGVCKFIVFLLCLVASIITDANFDKSIEGAAGFIYVLFVTNFVCVFIALIFDLLVPRCRDLELETIQPY